MGATGGEMSSGPRYNRKPDGNHADIKGELVKVEKRRTGLKVVDISAYPRFGADLMVFYQDKGPVFLEIKAGKSDPLTESEERLKALCAASGTWHRIETFDDALRALGISTERAPGEW